ncbi:DegT/DnrJ/EryC1/StrS family aminotransferase [Flagellimonas aequoris]|uniref:DegT/DnrJ/EryC1/StrS family aminotransferase n=1 Tax=Flagellimonas aequoris TaxID=2306997 RepID=A0A418N9M5_9FLAO|nr:DegT/DnrJ/EryC1/StrS family aminotransferase [Allomuricauda aequoris]RIV72573.1 DegT/DnrJ/EryC1/StrS family aminotransferase [Allomuricauda aequoris]TXK05073.1 DegT/DnrJ/EryC1/StrS family aminotransferase [Allomuricauda aequoris]
MKIDFANLTKAFEAHKEEFERVSLNVMSSARYILGEETEEFEQNLSVFTGNKYALSCSSGTDALLLAMMAMGLKSGDEVITTPFTFIATAETIACLGAKPIFVDIDEETYNIDVSKIEQAITKNTKAIIPVSLYGQMADMDEINTIANKHNLVVIEDAAQSFGATYKGKKSCNVSTFGCTSFFPAKPLGCFGDGGAIFASNEEDYQKIKAMRVHGQVERYTHHYIGMGGRLDNLQAAILNVKLKTYENDISRRQAVAKKYSDKLSDNIIKPTIKADRTSVWAQYTVRVKERDRVQKELKDHGIPTAVHYPIPMHLQKCFSYLEYDKGDFPISEQCAQEVMSLPMNPYLDDAEIDYITSKLNTLI